MFYYGTNIVWPTMVAVYFTDATTPLSKVNGLAIVQGLGITTGATILSFGGTPFARWGIEWRWQLSIALTIMTAFGGALAAVTPERMSLGIAMAFLSATGYGFGQYLTIAYIQFGADQIELGIAGGLAGVARYAGGAVAVTIYETILGNVQGSHAATGVPAAVVAAGGTVAIGDKILAALPLGAAALAKVQGATTAMIEAAGAAYIQSYVIGVRYVIQQASTKSLLTLPSRTCALTSIAFGVVGVIAALLSEDIGPKMNSKIEIFLENDTQAEKNKFH